jgi:subtilisin-like proprotein convertase family protein
MATTAIIQPRLRHLKTTVASNTPPSALNGKQANGFWRLELCDIQPALNNGAFRHAKLYLTPVSADLSLSKQLPGCTA